MNFSRVTERRPKPVVRSFVFVAENSARTALKVYLQYLAPTRVKEVAEQERTRIMSTTRYNRLADQQEQEEQLKALLNEVMAMPVKRVSDPDGKPVTVRLMSELIGGLDPEAIQAAGGLEAPVAFDVEATEAADPADCIGDDGKPDPAVKTVGDVARRNVLLLIRENPQFAEWVTKLSSDPSAFQDADWEARVKNSPGTQPAA